MDLADVPDQGDGKEQPPGGGDEERNLETPGGHPGDEEHGDAGDKGDAGTDVPPGVAVGGHHIHPLVGGDVGEHGIIKDVAGGIPQPGRHKDPEEPEPVGGAGQAHRPQEAQGQGAEEEPPFHPLVVRHRPQDGGKHRQDQDGGRGDQPPQPRGGGGVHSRFLHQLGEKQGDGGGDQHGESGIGHVVKDPADLGFGQSLGLFHQGTSFPSFFLCEKKKGSKKETAYLFPECAARRAPGMLPPPGRENPSLSAAILPPPGRETLFSFWERSGLRSGSCAASKGVLQ